jgi:hypothetical protein
MKFHTLSISSQSSHSASYIHRWILVPRPSRLPLRRSYLPPHALEDPTFCLRCLPTTVSMNTGKDMKNILTHVTELYFRPDRWKIQRSLALLSPSPSNGSESKSSMLNTTKHVCGEMLTTECPRAYDCSLSNICRSQDI